MDIAKLPAGGSIPSSSKMNPAIEEAAQNVTPPEQTELKSVESDSIRMFVNTLPPLSRAEREESSKITFEGYNQAKAGVRGIVSNYKEALSTIRKEEPDLLAKKWDIAVNSEDELIIKTGGAGISASEVQLLAEVFDTEEVKKGLKDLQDGVIRMTEANYQSELNTGSAAHYNLDTESAALVISAREILDGLAHNGPGREFSLWSTLSNQLVKNGDAFLKPETKNLRFIEVEV
ncbi:hypothetical protein GCM10011297_13300 [Bacterioplanes sanyensis]|uniref:hypothetical protein n=1 Tax=Bacterioplanes sanyensis TaxID=1249553 RepID=UPI00167C2EE9|nr:hypothetical protein [Bacterioplanes sanyensis]GGY41637.1 hypothetical protein GCM10011297_13300 [Bacterioplanes sanyensis]